MTPIMTNYPALDKGIATLRTLEGDAYLSPKTVEFRDERVICLTSTPRTGNDGSWIQAGKQGNSHSRHKGGTEKPKPEREVRGLEIKIVNCQTSRSSRGSSAIVEP